MFNLSLLLTRVLWISILMAPWLLAAQARAERIVFTTGGTFLNTGNLVKLYSYPPGDTAPHLILAREGDFSNAVVADYRYAYAHIGRAGGHPRGQDLLIRYDLIQQQVVDSFSCAGVQTLAVNDQYLFVSRGFGADSNYIWAFDKLNLAQGPVFRDTSIRTSTSDVLLTEEEAFVSFTENGVGYIERYRLAGGLIRSAERFPLDSQAAGLGSLHFFQNRIVGLAEIVDFPPPNFNPVVRHANLVFLDTATGSFSLDSRPARTNTGVGIVRGLIFGDFGGGLQGIDLTTGTFQDTLYGAPFTGGVFNRADSMFALAETDYFSYGKISLIPYAGGGPVQSFEVDISGTAVDIAYNHPPLARDSNFVEINSFPPNLGSYDISGLYTDPEGDSLRLIAIDATPPNPTLAFSAAGIIQYDGANRMTLQYVVEDPWGARDTATVEFDYRLSIEDAKATFNIGPNPVAEALHLKFLRPDASRSLDVVDLRGRRHFSMPGLSGLEHHLPLGFLPPGMYVLHIRGSRGTASRTFVKR